MVQGYYTAVIKELRRIGYEYDRNAKGSHERWSNASTNVSVIVPRNLYSRHTANDILKEAGSTTRL
jgi:predicted RNA binding protein YcfA (HicA-like mRNA interferase family)